MKYFTAELLEQFRSQDDRLAEAATDEWEKRADAYAAYLRSVRAQLPARLGELLDNYYLHDAEIVCAASLEGEYQVNLKLATPPHTSLLLAYKSVDTLEVLPPKANPPGPPAVAWLYDELEVETDKAVFKHSILLTNGWELRISFRDFNFSTCRSNGP